MSDRTPERDVLDDMFRERKEKAKRGKEQAKLGAMKEWADRVNRAMVYPDEPTRDVQDLRSMMRFEADAISAAHEMQGMPDWMKFISGVIAGMALAQQSTPEWVEWMLDSVTHGDREVYTDSARRMRAGHEASKAAFAEAEKRVDKRPEGDE